ncbi:MAG TPA: DUF1893 domain-containing protein [Smithellaceae bacterium]|nr:DUF1893 domain-containing protein [Smithellaceae bacterium]HRS89328.1 DUF1893 domain-containing protein [Smithellaceae bacterium]HRV25198.1 DUF1893 domain-containing protein [Smithellaceae bacterium]
MQPDFTKYSLALIKNNHIVYSSQESGLRPLWDCLQKYRGAGNNFTLFDKIIGLAAARLIADAQIISRIETLLASAPAKKSLQENNILLKARQIVPNILTKDRGATCPGEIIALNTADTGEFLAKIEKMLKRQ